MSAHILTVINQIIQDPEREFPHLKHALDYAPWANDLDFSDAEELYQLVYENDIDGVEGWAYSHRQKYHSRYSELGYPDTREEWIKAEHKQYLQSEIADLEHERDQIEKEWDDESFDDGGLISRQNAIEHELVELRQELAKLEEVENG